MHNQWEKVFGPVMQIYSLKGFVTTMSQEKNPDKGQLKERCY
jgi:hypothetical protein